MPKKAFPGYCSIVSWSLGKLQVRPLETDELFDPHKKNRRDYLLHSGVRIF
jgi:hypothetical protein